jgi:histidine triad (HIT) family protein
MSDPSCIFCKIAAGTIPASVVHASERLVAFRDIDPKAPVHILVIPREHLGSLDAADERHGALLGEILLLARRLARDEGIAERGYRTVINTGAEGGQSVDHLHLHLLGGRGLGWPPG